MFEILGIKKEERKEFLRALISGISIMVCAYVIAWAAYVFAPSYYGW